MRKVYLVAGMGADSRLYKNIVLPVGFVPVPTDWLVPEPEDTLSTYAGKLIMHYNIRKDDMVIGNSLGGMIAVEIAKQVRLNKVILISSIKKISEAPAYFKLFKALPVYKAIPDRLLTGAGLLIELIFGRMDPADLALFKNMLGNSSPVFLRWAMRAALYFDNLEDLPNLYHLIGDQDLVFPYKLIELPTAVVKGGTHIMMFDRAAEINQLLAQILAQP